MLGTPLFDELAALGRAVRYRRGERLVRAGERSAHVVVVRAGVVKIVTSSTNGDEMIVALRGPGDLIGELSVVSGGEAWATAEVLEEVDANAVPARRFLEFTRAHPDVLVLLVQRLTIALRQADQKRLELATLDLPARVARTVLELRRIRADPTGSVAVSQEELAHLCGASREAVARVLRTFRESGWVRTERRTVSVEDVHSLAATAEVPFDALELGGPIDLR